MNVSPFSLFLPFSQTRTLQVGNVSNMDVSSFSLFFTFSQAKTLHDENASLKMKQRNMAVLELERDELSRQLESAKDDFFREQKQSRLQREEMSEVSVKRSEEDMDKKKVKYTKKTKNC